MRWEGIWRRWGSEKDYEDKAEKESEEIIIMNEGRTINLKELLHYTCLKWRFIFVCMIVFAVLADGFSYMRSRQQVSNIEQQGENINVEQFESELTDREIIDTKEAVENYIIYEGVYEKYKEYNENSVKMQINANSVSTKRLIYQISGNQEVKNISDTYIGILPNSEICEKITQEIGWDKEIAYVEELISATNSHMNVISIGEQNISNVVENNETTDEAALLTVNLISIDEESCNMMGNVVNEEVTSIATKLRGIYGDFEIELVSDEYCEEANRELLAEQQTCISEMNNANAIMNNVKTTLSEQQQNYFSALLEEKENEIADNFDANIETVKTEDVKIQFFNIKYIIAGAILGLFLSCCYTMFKFILDKRLITRCFVEQNLKCNYWGLFFESEERKKIGQHIDRWINSIFMRSGEKLLPEEKLEMLCTSIKASMIKNNIEKIYITSSIDSNEVRSFLKKMEDCMNDGQIIFEIGKSILRDADSLQAFTQSQGVIFVEQMGKSYMQDIYQEIDCCTKYQVFNLGVVTIE